MRHSLIGLAILAVAAMTPVCGMANDQQIADFVKTRLAAHQQNGSLRGFNVDMRVENGTIWLSGDVSSEQQEQLILETAQQASHLGAKQVVDDINVRNMGSVRQASVMQPQQMDQMAYATYQEPVQQYQQAPATLSNVPVPMNGQMMQAQQVGAPMPMPMGYASGGAPAMAGGQPNMPGYAWPGYAASPNYAAVQYPQQYSASAWPYIGPFYPYPQVPLGWRKVQLEWDDGWWFLDFKDR